MKALGIDVGSLNVKAVILDGSGPLASIQMPAGEGAEASARIAMEEVIKKAGINPDGGILWPPESAAKPSPSASSRKPLPPAWRGASSASSRPPAWSSIWAPKPAPS